MTTTFRSNLGGVSSSGSLTSFKERIATCLQRWRQKHIQQQRPRQHHPPLLQEEVSHRQRKPQECSFVERACCSFKTLNAKLQQFIAHVPRKDFECFRSKKKVADHQVEIVAKLLSSTLLATTTTTTTTRTTKTRATELTGNSEKDTSKAKAEEVTENHIAFRSSLTSIDMTVTDVFLEICQDYPDLESEIRGILMARAQQGATIAEIRDDYRNITGMVFPIYDNVTEFLLSIPSVSAYCNEYGTRIFSIRPMEKTKHLYDLVVQQKPPQVARRQMCLNSISDDRRYYFRKSDANSNNSSSQNYSWRNNKHRQLQQQSYNNYNKSTTNTMTTNKSRLPVAQYNAPQPQPQRQVIAEKSVSQSGSERYTENNQYYQDNCNYLFNRLYNQSTSPSLPPLLAKNSSNPTFAKPHTLDPKYNKNNLNTNRSTYQNNATYQNDRMKSNISHNPAKQGMLQSSRSSSPTATKSCFTNESMYTESDYEAHLLDFPLLGDDFFLHMARMELKCKFKKYEKVLQSGLCVSGQTIGGAIRRVRQLVDCHRSIIVNIGSVDIMQGRQLVQIEHDFRELVNVMLRKGITPILTTLAPLANYAHDPLIKRKLERFNEFIKREGSRLLVIDIWSCLVSERKQTLFDCFQNEPRSVSGTSESYVFWNKIGRQRVLQLIESKLEY